MKDLSENPLNLVLRFALEMSALLAMGFWGWHWNPMTFPLITAIIIPVIAATLWGTFAVPDDPSRSGEAPVPVPGLVRLFLELIFFATAVFMLFRLEKSQLAFTLGILTLIHYLISVERIKWLLKR